MSVINTNLKALAAQESMRSTDLKLSAAMERLSTGKRINAAKDDAAGLSITNRMTAQVRGMTKAIQNSNDAISMTQTAEGGYANVNDILTRMRELAVQSATGTMNAGDRASMQLEVAQLRMQIDDIASKTNHNNIKLLDGSAQNIVIQSGSNAGDTIKLNFQSTRTQDIGIGTKATLSSSGGYYSAAAFAALTASSLYLNGVAVGASMATDDNASYSQAASSSIAKAAAINRVADISGVYAKAGPTVMSGGPMAVDTTSSAVTLTINNVTLDDYQTSTVSTSITRKNAVAAINAKSSQTGVVATDTGDDNTGITLTAADGRNITISGGQASTSGFSSGSSAGVTFVGSYDLFTLDGRDINISFKTGSTATQEMSGLRTGTYKADTAIFTTYSRTAGAVGTAPSSSTTGLLNANSMIINGVAIGQALATDDSASDTTSTSSTRAASAIAIAAAINRSKDLTGVTASAAPNILRTDSFTAPTTVAAIAINGITISVNQQTRNGFVDTINTYSNRTGVVASAWGDGVQLTAADGRNITLGSTSASSLLGSLTAGANSATGTAGVTYYSQVTLSSANTFNVRAGSNGVPNLEYLGFRQGTFGGQDNGLKINQVDISTQSTASQAIVAIDAAINTISKAQANSGALNNRLDYIVNNLSEMSQNLQASRSRILDTDYASETTNLAKQQIISQAATAMLAQANQQPQSVLSLLK